MGKEIHLGSLAASWVSVGVGLSLLLRPTPITILASIIGCPAAAVIPMLGTHFTVLVDGVADGHFLTRTAAILHAIKLREQQDPTKIGG